MISSELLAWCKVCHGEFEVTKAGRVKTHLSPSVGQAVKAPRCPGSLKDFELGMVVKCGDCGATTRKASTRALHKHSDPKGETCMAASQEYDLIVETLGAVEISPNGSEAPPPTPTSTSDSSTSGEKSPAPSSKSGTRENGSASPTMPISEPSITSSSAAPPSSDAMFGSAGVRAPRRKRQVLEGRAAELASQMKEVWWSSQSRSERTLQATIGPSEVGLDCMRRLAMKIAGMQQVNHDGHPWAAWVGTAMHSAYEVMFTQASGTSGRWITETRVEIGSAVVPKGTADLFDRHLHRVIDHKNMGKSSLSKAWLDGPSQQYVKQLQVYGLGLERMGEDVREVALVAWPREGNTLADLYAWVADYDRDVAVAAIAKVESIAKRLLELGDGGWRKAPKTPGYGCKFCPFYLPGDKAETKGCSA